MLPLCFTLYLQTTSAAEPNITKRERLTILAVMVFLRLFPPEIYKKNQIKQISHASSISENEDKVVNDKEAL